MGELKKSGSFELVEPEKKKSKECGYNSLGLISLCSHQAECFVQYKDVVDTNCIGINVRENAPDNIESNLGTS